MDGPLFARPTRYIVHMMSQKYFDVSRLSKTDEIEF